MVPRVWSLMRFLIKGSVAGGAIYLVYDQELLGPSDKSQAVLQKAEEVVPTAVYQFSQYVCEQTGLKLPQLPGRTCAAFERTVRTASALLSSAQAYPARVQRPGPLLPMRRESAVSEGRGALRLAGLPPRAAE
uniref:MICOS complex subunit MIC13 n=1 Tax=Moschus moschiferus TaxID=68415 RepID=A0A8C6D9D2_MOSMO